MQQECSGQQSFPGLESEEASSQPYTTDLDGQPSFEPYPLTPDPCEQQSPDLRPFNTPQRNPPVQDG